MPFKGNMQTPLQNPVGLPEKKLPLSLVSVPISWSCKQAITQKGLI